MISSILITPVSAANGNEFINFNDYATYQTSADGTMVYVDADLPLNSALVYYTGVVYYPDPGNGRFYIPVSTLSQDLRFNPLGGYGTGAFPDVGEQERAVNFIDITYIPANAILTFGCQIELSSEVINRDFIPSDLHYAFVDSDGVVVSSYYDSYEFSWYQNKVTAKYVLDLTYTLDLSTVNLPSNAVGLYFQYWFYDYFVDEGTLIAEFQHFKMQFPYSAIQQEAINNQKLQQSLNKIDKAIERQNQILQNQNDKLDDIISGGSAGEDLMAGSDKLEDAGSDLGDDLGSIQDFEDQYMGQLDDNMDEVIAGADLTWIYPALSFVQRYLNKIVAGIPSKYLIVFTLPMFFGLFMYIVGHPVRAPRPDTSGDEVTRETFTETHILTGKNAGTVRSTRTVTTSREIGRVHNE